MNTGFIIPKINNFMVTLNILEHTPCVCSSFYCNIPTIRHISDINYAYNRYSIFNRELEKLIFGNI